MIITKYHFSCYEKELCQNLKNSLYVLPKIVTFSRFSHPDDWLCTFIDWYRVHFYPWNFVYSRISPRIQFLECSLSSVAPCAGPMLDTKENVLKFRSAIAGKCIFLRFFLKLQSFMGSFEKKLTRKNHITFLLYTCLKVSQPKSMKNRWMEWKIFRKRKRKNTSRNWVSLLNSRLSFYYLKKSDFSGQILIKLRLR